MTEVLHANIFFLITGVAVIIFTALLCVALYHGIKVLKSLRRIMDRVEEGTETIAEEIQNVRAYLSDDGLLKRIFSTLLGRSRNTSAREPKAKKPDKKRTELTISHEE